jgi:hypothetical protein
MTLGRLRLSVADDRARRKRANVAKESPALRLLEAGERYATCAARCRMKPTSRWATGW